MIKSLLLPLCLCVSMLTINVQAQEKIKADSPLTSLDEVVITSTRTEQKLGNVAVPVIVINEKTIKQSGSLRLTNILQEQTGLYITNGFGNGVQVQGLSPDYVMILIDGEPIVGRNAGVLDLNRITVNNIKRIEIVKGPSSSLYGSEAMGGVINIITTQATTNTWNANLRYGRFNAIDANIGGTYKKKGFTASAFVNRNSTDGYDFNKTDIGQTAMPYNSYTSQVKLQQQFNKLVKAGASVRYYYELQNDLYSAGSSIASGKPKINEYNINPFVQLHFNNKVQTVFRGYLSQYQSKTQDYLAHNDSLYYDDFFQQRFQRIENQTDIRFATNNTLTAGGGYTKERLNTNRYSGIRTNTIGYAYLQDEHQFGKIATVIAGARYDNNQAYESRISPKLALQVRPTPKLHINASYGSGFKAPDYRQLYLNFTNNAAGGYTVYGANEVTSQLLQQQLQAGILSSITGYGSQLKLLKPEYSTGLNAAANYAFSKKFTAGINFFRNDIDNLIVTQIIAFKSTNAPVYSYFNINSAFTQGAEANIRYQLTNNIRIEGGYQYLETADKAILDNVKAGKVFGKKEGSLLSYQLTKSDYGGLMDRSKHMANIKIFYQQGQWFTTLRTLYRSRFGVADKDGNLVLNRDDEYAASSILLNLSCGYHFKNGLQISSGIDNITNYRNEQYVSTQPGISYYINIAYQFSK